MHRLWWACAISLIVTHQAALAIDRVAQIESVHSNKCLDVSGSSKEPEAPIIQYSCTGGDNQNWAIKDRGDSVHDITAIHSGLDVFGASTEDAAAIIQYPCNGQANQGFRITEMDGVLTITSANSAKCLDIEGGAVTDQAKVIHYACSGQPNQHVRLK